MARSHQKPGHPGEAALVWRRLCQAGAYLMQKATIRQTLIKAASSKTISWAIACNARLKLVPYPKLNNARICGPFVSRIGLSCCQWAKHCKHDAEHDCLQCAALVFVATNRTMVRQHFAQLLSGLCVTSKHPQPPQSAARSPDLASELLEELRKPLLLGPQWPGQGHFKTYFSIPGFVMSFPTVSMCLSQMFPPSRGLRATKRPSMAWCRRFGRNAAKQNGEGGGQTDVFAEIGQSSRYTLGSFSRATKKQGSCTKL